MAENILRRLQPQFRNHVTEEFLGGSESLQVSEYTQRADPDQYDIDPLINIVNFAMKEFRAADRVDSDKWLAPRVHSALRLTRRQASDRGIWDWLAMGPLQHYVRWRHPGGKDQVTLSRFTASDMNRQAISRLWWGAELTRNGADYSATEILFHLQDIQNVWSVARFFRNRPVAIAALRFLSGFNDGEYTSSKQAQTLGKAFKSILTTTVVDSVVESPGVDVSAIDDWYRDEDSRNETKWQTELPEGPPEQQCKNDDIERAYKLLQHLVSVTRFSESSLQSI